MYLSTSAYKSQSTIVPSGYMVGLADEPLVGPIFATIYWISLYITSGVFNFTFVVEHFYSVHTLGATQGEVITRGLSILTNREERPAFVNPLSGLYQTAFSDIYIDFGVWGGIAQSFAMGAIAAHVHWRRVQGRALGLFLDPVAKTFLLVSPLVSSFTGAGLYYLVAAVGIWVLSWLFTRRPAMATARGYSPSTLEYPAPKALR
jgi:hypothetical protein